MPERARRAGAGSLRPPPPPDHCATVYQLDYARRAGLARMAAAGWRRAAYTPGAPRHRLSRARAFAGVIRTPTRTA